MTENIYPDHRNKTINTANKKERAWFEILNKLQAWFYFSPKRVVEEIIFQKKFKRRAVVDLGDWNMVYPDRNIASYVNIAIDRNFKELAENLHSEDKILLSVREMWNLYNWLLRTAHLAGAVAEVGVYNGGSAKLICQTETNKKIYLFDTFSGIPSVNQALDKLAVGQFAGGGLAAVKDYLAAYSNVEIYQGIFPASAEKRFAQEKFSLVHLDVDVYQSTLESLAFFYLRLVKGGVILVHDYRCLNAPGVKQAVDEFFADKPETVVELWDTQALIIKL